MTTKYVVVDGSNIATEGRSMPSLAQLDQAVRAFMEERPTEQVIVVVDASFGYRIEESERSEYEQAEAAGEIVSPPAGAVGRGDGFLLKIADRTGAAVLSNDSFQEFHGEYPWLFEDGRLYGGKPVPGVGWIFTPRTPVRGPRSRESVRSARKAQKAALKRATVADGPVAVAIAEATAEAIDPEEATRDAGDAADDGGAAKAAPKRRRRAKPVGTVNDPLPFIQFIADHPLGTEVEGKVDGFTSHGAFVEVGGARCYVPLVALADPPPRSAKSVLKKGETRKFVVQALDPPRRGIELALPEVARVAGTPTEETVEADIGAGRKARPAAKAAPAEAEAAPTPAEPAAEEQPAPAKRARRSRKKAADVPVEAVPAEPPVPAEPVKARRSRARKAAVTEEPPAPAPEPAPAPARAARKRRAAVAEPPVEAPAPEPAPVSDAPKRPRRSKKAAVTVAAEAIPEPVPPAPEPPPPRPRRSRKAAAAEVPSEAPVEPPPEPVKKATRKRAAAKKKAAGPPPAPEPAPEPEPEPATPTRRRRRKTADG